MKSLSFRYLVLAMVLGFVSAANAAPANPLTGYYGYLSADGQRNLVAHVFVRNSELFAKFKGCTARLEYRNGSLEGRCIAGRGYASVRYLARLGYQRINAKAVPVLQWRAEEYGDEENGFDSMLVAYQFESR